MQTQNACHYGKAAYRSQFFDRDHVSANDQNLSAGAGSGGGEPEHKIIN
jgi:hypothetical protein